MNKEKITFHYKKDYFTGNLYKTNSNKAIIMLHGFGGTSKNLMFIYLANMLAKENVSSLMFDFYNLPHNISTHKSEEMSITFQLKVINEAINYLTKRGYKEFYLLGHSLGGYTAYIYASTDKKIKKLVTLAPPYDLMFNRLSSNINLKKWEEQGYWQFPNMKINYSFVKDANKYNLNKLKLNCPFISFHCKDDQIVPYEQAKKYNAELTTFDKGGHHFNGKIKEIGNRLLSFLNS